MRLKSDIYKNEQNELIEKIITILDLDEKNSITLYELDNDKEKQEEIMALSPKIKKYFSLSKVNGIQNLDKNKRPFLALIKHVTKSKYKFVSGECVLSINNNRIRTKRHYFIKIN